MLVRNKLDMLLREILLRERAVRKELSDSPKTSKRYGCASLEGSKAKNNSIPVYFFIYFLKKGRFHFGKQGKNDRLSRKLL